MDNPFGLQQSLPNNFQPYQFPQDDGSNSFSGFGGQNYPVSGGTGQNSNTAPSGSSGSNSAGSIAGGVGSLVGAGFGLYNYFSSQNQLKKLENQPQPNYTVSAGLQNSYNQANAMSNEGFTPGEKAGYQNQINQQGATAYSRAAQEGGGNLSNVISAGINSQQIQGTGQMSIADADLKRRNMQQAASLAGQIQEQQNKAVATNIQIRQQQEQNLGQSSTAGLQSFYNSIGGVASGVGALAAL
jgi:hypothetical protein